MSPSLEIQSVPVRICQPDRPFWELRLAKHTSYAGHANSYRAIVTNNAHSRTVFSHNQLVRRERFIRGEHRIPRHSEQLRPNPRRGQPRAPLSISPPRIASAMEPYNCRCNGSARVAVKCDRRRMKIPVDPERLPSSSVSIRYRRSTPELKAAL